MNNILCISDFFKTSDFYSGNVLLDEPLSPRTTFKIGSNADILLEPFNIDSFIFSTSHLHDNNMNYFVLGGGSNIVFPDTNYNGIIISTSKLNQITKSPLGHQSSLVTAECGTHFSAVVNFSIRETLSGVEQFAGLPGSIGGAVFMNARCFEKSISDILYSTTFYDIQTKQTKTELFNSSEWDYKKSPFKNTDKVILSATFTLNQNTSTQEEIKQSCNHFTAERINKGHFKYPSAGSVFKNNHNFGKPTGQLIDEVGLKGLQIGGAQIASWHGNFIINIGKAKASDVKALVQIAKEKVYKKFGFSIEPEIIFVDNLKA